MVAGAGAVFCAVFTEPEALRGDLSEGGIVRCDFAPLFLCVCVDTRGRSRASDEMFGLVDREIERKNGRGGRARRGKAVAWIASVGCLMNTSEDTRTRIGKGGTRRCRVACEMRCNCGCGKGER